MARFRVSAFAVFLLFFALPCSASALRPETIAGMEAVVTIGASGSFSGVVHNGDKMTVRFLTFQDSENQKVLEVEEKMFIGGETIEATHEDINGNEYAAFEIGNLMDYSAEPEFEISVKARIRTEAEIEIGQDYGLGSGEMENPEFLQASANIETTDAELVELAGREFKSKSEIGSIRDIAEWVKRNIKYDMEYYDGTWGASDTFRAGRGVCDEFANLTAAFMRIKGIPARYVSGVSFDGERFGNHGWVEAFLPGRGWIGVDSTYGEAGYVDAAHFALAGGTDVNELTNVQITTLTKESLRIETTLLEPIVEIVSARNFSGVVDAAFEPEALESEQEFSLKVRVHNRRGANMIIPVQLMLHQEFRITDNERLLWLEPEGEGSITFSARAPKFEKAASYGRYGMVLLLPDGNVSGFLEVYPKGLTGAKEVTQYKLIDEAWLRPENLAFFAFAVVGVPVIIIVLKRLLRKKISKG